MSVIIRVFIGKQAFRTQSVDIAGDNIITQINSFIDEEPSIKIKEQACQMQY